MASHPVPAVVLVTGAGKPGYPARLAAWPADPPSPHQRRARQAATPSWASRVPVWPAASLPRQRTLRRARNQVGIPSGARA